MTGAGGVGTTRLALRVAAGVRRAFADGVWLVEQAEWVDGALRAHTVVQALKIQLAAWVATQREGRDR